MKERYAALGMHAYMFRKDENVCSIVYGHVCKKEEIQSPFQSTRPTQRFARNLYKGIACLMTEITQ